MIRQSVQISTRRDETKRMVNREDNDMQDQRLETIKDINVTWFLNEKKMFQRRRNQKRRKARRQWSRIMNRKMPAVIDEARKLWRAQELFDKLETFKQSIVKPVTQQRAN